MWGFCDDLTTLHLPGGVIPAAGGVSSAVGSTATPAPGPSIEMEEGKHGGTPSLVGAMREGEGGGESGVEGAVGREAAVCSVVGMVLYMVLTGVLWCYKPTATWYVMAEVGPE